MLVTFEKSGRSAEWTPSSYSILDFAEEQGLTPAFSCRAGICSTCKTKLISGEIDYFELPLDEPEPGEALLCCSKPVTDIVLDL